jgi:hypothetical protein
MRNNNLPSLCEFTGSLAWHTDLTPVHPIGVDFHGPGEALMASARALPAQHAEGRVRFDAQARIKDALHSIPLTGIVLGIAGQPARQSAEPMRVPDQRTRAKT